jgi:hypothetical protein
MVFLNLHKIHNYYMLHVVFVVCFGAATALVWLKDLIVTGAMKFSRVDSLYLARGVSALFAAALIAYGVQLAQMRLAAGPDWGSIRAGQYLNQNTPEDAMIFYIVGRPNWDPQVLYYAKREGYNLPLQRFDKPVWRRRIDASFQSGRPVFLFVRRPFFGKIDENFLRAWKIVGNDARWNLYEAAERG